MGGTPNPDNLANIAVSGDQANFEYDLDDDQIQNENDSFPLDASADVRLGIVQPKQIQYQLILIQDVPHEEPHIHNSMTGTETEFQIGMTLMMTMMV